MIRSSSGVPLPGTLSDIHNLKGPTCARAIEDLPRRAAALDFGGPLVSRPYCTPPSPAGVGRACVGGSPLHAHRIAFVSSKEDPATDQMVPEEHLEDQESDVAQRDDTRQNAGDDFHPVDPCSAIAIAVTRVMNSPFAVM